MFWQEAVFSAAIAVVVTVSMTWVGLLVINSLLVLPAAAARNVARNMRQYHLFSLLGAVISGLAGLMTSYYIGSSAGASITLYLAVWFAVTFLLRKSVYKQEHCGSLASAVLLLAFMPESNPPRRRPGHPAPRPCRRRERRPYSTAR